MAAPALDVPQPVRTEPILVRRAARSARCGGGRCCGPCWCRSWCCARSSRSRRPPTTGSTSTGTAGCSGTTRCGSSRTPSPRCPATCGPATSGRSGGCWRSCSTWPRTRWATSSGVPANVAMRLVSSSPRRSLLERGRGAARRVRGGPRAGAAAATVHGGRGGAVRGRSRASSRPGGPARSCCSAACTSPRRRWCSAWPRRPAGSGRAAGSRCGRCRCWWRPGPALAAFNELAYFALPLATVAVAARGRLVLGHSLARAGPGRPRSGADAALARLPAGLRRGPGGDRRLLRGRAVLPRLGRGLRARGRRDPSGTPGQPGSRR